jgi:CRISPR-associated protein Cas2
MTVILAHDTPDSVRGMLKRWFIEPQANVFVGSLNIRTRDKTLAYIKRNTEGIALLMISSDPGCQGFKIEMHGKVRRKGVVASGLWLVAEEWMDSANLPF